jgi:hypothetical protein
MTKDIFAILLITLIGISATAQEVLTSPAFNPAVAKEYSVRKKSANAVSPALTLPFYDDFSVISVYPSPLRWTDAFAFVNTDYAKFPPSVGVATMDALDDKGVLYKDAGPNAFDADYLTSQPIRLDSIFSPAKNWATTRADSIYLSFLYQPQGRTISPPSKKSSLWLEFHSPDEFDTIVTSSGTTIEPKWRTIWTTDGGITVDSFAKPDNHYFRQVMIPLTGLLDSVLYYKNGFQFRFHNIAALSGNSQPDWRNNGSHWNIDVVYLSNGRELNKTNMYDVAFGDNPPSMLRNYESMPYNQYRKNFINEMKDTLDIAISNLDNILHNVSYKYEVRKNSLPDLIAPAYDGGSGNVKPFLTNGYTDWPSFARPPVNFFFPISNEEKVVFHVTHYLSPDPNPLFRSNDTVHYDQLFSNYYAYDNGTAEAGVGINGASGSYAVQFKLNESDTLRGIQVYFNPIIGGNNESIDLNVWNDGYGTPGVIKKTISGVSPISGNGLNRFNTYWFENPIVINPVDFPSLIFYIGWSQSSVNNINIGLDRVTDSHTKRFFNVNGTWIGSDSINYGSLLLRPIVGLENPLGIDKPADVQKLRFQPNPVSDGNLFILLPETWNKKNHGDLNVTIISSSGSLVYNDSFSVPVNVSNIASGFYMVILTDKQSGQKASGKLLIR